MYFNPPSVGDDAYYTLTINANDKNGNETEEVYYIQYHFVDDGDETGTVHIVIDATAAGAGVLDDAYVTIKQGKPASYTVVQALEDFGYTYDSGGTEDNGFYLSRIYRGGLMYGVEPPEKLINLIERDGIYISGQSSVDSLGERDFTAGSGWMYTINDSGYAGKGLSAYYLSDGDELYLRFTLAYGKDIGGESLSGGILSYYCGTWINGSEYWNHECVENIIPATCMTNGEIDQVCSICGETISKEEIPMLGHDFVETERVEPTEEADGYIKYKCSRCGEEKTEVIPMITPEPSVEPTDEPDKPTDEP